MEAHPRVTDVTGMESPPSAGPAAGTAAEGDAALAGGGTTRMKQNRLEKKCRKALVRLGLQPVRGVTKVTIRRSQHFMLTITDVEVFKSATSDTYVVFGDAKVEDATPKSTFNYADIMNAANAMTAAAAGAGGAGGAGGGGAGGAGGAAGAPAATATAAATETAAAGAAGAAGADGDAAPAAAPDAASVIEEKDIDLVVSQASCTREVAIEALRKNNNDIVEAIIAVTGM